jgi:hypothetical protein
MALRLVLALLLIVLPGQWISFGLPLKGLSYWFKVLIGVALTPLVVGVEFYAIRLLGASFGLTASLLVIVNLPVAYLLVRDRPPFSPPDATTILTILMVSLVILASCAPLLLDPQKRLYTWESWMHADIIYSLANGNLLLQDTEIAGVTLAYPWIGHIYEGTLSYLLDSPPVTSYIWFNLVWLIVIFGFVAGIVADLGGNRMSQAGAAVWLSFGVNFVGYVLARIVPPTWADRYHVLLYIEGDNRYTPWLDPVVAFSQIYLGLGLFTAIVFLILRSWPNGHGRYYLILIGLLLCGLGIIYPVLLPAAFAVVGAKVLLMLFRQMRGRLLRTWPEISGLVGILVVAGLVTLIWVRLLTGARTGLTLISINNIYFIRYESIITAVVMSPLLLGFAVAIVRRRKENGDALIMLGLGGLASLLLYVLFDVPWWRNEYKFIFTAAICLAPFTSIALEPVLNRLRRLALPALGLLTIVLASPFAYKVYVQSYYYYTRPGPPVDASHFDLRLDQRQPLSELLNIIRDKTPVDSLLVLENTATHYPTLTQRQLYVAPAEATPQPGILVTSDEMLTLVKGYPKELVEERRAVVKGLFESDDPAQMATSLDDILAFRRPLVLLLDEQRQAPLRQWLTKEGIGSSIYEGEGLIVWVIASGTTAPSINTAPIGAQSKR